MAPKAKAKVAARRSRARQVCTSGTTHQNLPGRAGLAEPGALAIVVYEFLRELSTPVPGEDWRTHFL